MTKMTAQQVSALKVKICSNRRPLGRSPLQPGVLLAPIGAPRKRVPPSDGLDRITEAVHAVAPPLDAGHTTPSFRPLAWAAAGQSGMAGMSW